MIEPLNLETARKSIGRVLTISGKYADGSPASAVPFCIWGLCIELEPTPREYLFGVHGITRQAMCVHLQEHSPGQDQSHGFHGGN